MPLRYRNVGWRRALVPGTAEPGIVQPLPEIALVDLAQPHRRDLAEAEDRQRRHRVDGKAPRDLGQAIDVDPGEVEVEAAFAQNCTRQTDQPLLDPPCRRRG